MPYILGVLPVQRPWVKFALERSQGVSCINSFFSSSLKKNNFSEKIIVDVLVRLAMNGYFKTSSPPPLPLSSSTYDVDMSGAVLNIWFLRLPASLTSS